MGTDTLSVMRRLRVALIAVPMLAAGVLAAGVTSSAAPPAATAQSGGDDTMTVQSGARTVTLRADAVCGRPPAGSGAMTPPCGQWIRPPRKHLVTSGGELRLRLGANARQVSWTGQYISDGRVRQRTYPTPAQSTENPREWTIQLGRLRRETRVNAIGFFVDYAEPVNAGTTFSDASGAFELGLRRPR